MPSLDVELARLVREKGYEIAVVYKAYDGKCCNAGKCVV
jgi:hypothetical protein